MKNSTEILTKNKGTLPKFFFVLAVLVGLSYFAIPLTLQWLGKSFWFNPWDLNQSKTAVQFIKPEAFILFAMLIAIIRIVISLFGTDEKPLKNNSSGLFLCFVIGLIWLGNIACSDSLILIDSHGIPVRTMWNKLIFPWTSFWKVLFVELGVVSILSIPALIITFSGRLIKSKKARRYLLTFLQMLSIFAGVYVVSLLIRSIPTHSRWDGSSIVASNDHSESLFFLLMAAITFAGLILLWLARIIIANSLKKDGVIPRNLRRMISHMYQWLLSHGPMPKI